MNDYELTFPFKLSQNVQLDKKQWTNNLVFAKALGEKSVSKYVTIWITLATMKPVK